MLPKVKRPWLSMGHLPVNQLGFIHPAFSLDVYVFKAHSWLSISVRFSLAHGSRDSCKQVSEVTTRASCFGQACRISSRLLRWTNLFSPNWAHPSWTNCQVCKSGDPENGWAFLLELTWAPFVSPSNHVFLTLPFLNPRFGPIAIDPENVDTQPIPPPEESSHAFHALRPRIAMGQAAPWIAMVFQLATGCWVSL